MHVIGFVDRSCSQGLDRSPPEYSTVVPRAMQDAPMEPERLFWESLS
ncbi:MAG TPA: hypothetical protein QGI71_06650 [Dehalococcoidia bacterium]|nr:hypothetical protein [Dehalococcoidia bacterium]